MKVSRIQHQRPKILDYDIEDKLHNQINKNCYCVYVFFVYGGVAYSFSNSIPHPITKLMWTSVNP